MVMTLLEFKDRISLSHAFAKRKEKEKKTYLKRPPPCFGDNGELA